jgi:hypothetical protein
MEGTNLGEMDLGVEEASIGNLREVHLHGEGLPKHVESGDCFKEVIQTDKGLDRTVW